MLEIISLVKAGSSDVLTFSNKGLNIVLFESIIVIIMIVNVFIKNNYLWILLSTLIIIKFIYYFFIKGEIQIGGYLSGFYLIEILSLFFIFKSVSNLIKIKNLDKN